MAHLRRNVLQAAAIPTTALATGLALVRRGRVLGLGTAMVYPTLLAGVGDVAAPPKRASAIGVYRLWRDLGFAIGAIVAGILADAAGIPAAILAVAALTAILGPAAGPTRETLPRPAGDQDGSTVPSFGESS